MPQTNPRPAELRPAPPPAGNPPPPPSGGNPPPPPSGAVFRALRAAEVEEDLAYNAQHEVMEAAGQNVTARLEAQMESQFQLLMTAIGSLKEELASVKQDVAGLRVEFKEEITSVKKDVTDVRVDVAGLRAEVSGLRTQSRWMFTTLAGVLFAVVTLFLTLIFS